MKNLFFTFSLIFAVILSANAQKRPAFTKKDYASFINRTNMIIRNSAEEVKKNKVYTGGIVAAIDYQKKALDELKTDRKRAINDSYIARRLAMKAYRSNKNTLPPKGWLLTPKEKHMVTLRVTPEMVDKILEKYKDKENEDNITPDGLDDVTDGDVQDDTTDNDNSDANENSKGKTGA